MSIFTQDFPAGLPIGNGWSLTRESAPVIFPFDGTVVCDAPVGNVEDANAALEHALGIRKAVENLSSYVRKELLARTQAALVARTTEFEQLLVLETGKPLRDCKVEVARTVLTLETAAGEVSRLHGETVPLDLLPSGEGMTGFWVRKPIGVVVGITGFNYPLLLASHKIAPAIAAGCPVIIKPAPQTPLSTLWLIHIMREIAAQLSIPQGVVQLVTGDANVGATLVSDPRIGAVSFTGSAGVGHAISRLAAPRKTLLELGSNSALVVDESANVGAAAAAAVRGSYYASGQACISVQRVIVLEAIAQEFISSLKKHMANVVVGDPRDGATHISALINEASTSRVSDWIAQAVSAGAVIAHGGTLQGKAFAPTVILEPPTASLVWHEEIFGPVMCVRTVATIDEAFALVNESRYGLQASIFTSSLANTFAALNTLEVGGVVVNDVPGFRSDSMPYGGVKDSGIGREGPRFAAEEFTITRMAIIRPDIKGANS
ncbi:MAG: aldehyde dehydrogenase family protein [Actinomycetes bacterium]